MKPALTFLGGDLKLRVIQQARINIAVIKLLFFWFYF